MKLNKKLKILIGILSLLIIVFAVSTIMDSKKSKSTFKSTLIDVDTNNVSKIYIKSKTAPTGFPLEKTNSTWTVKADDKSYPADAGLIKNIIQQLDLVKTKRVVSKTSDKWGEYEVNDSLGTFVSVYENGTLTANIIVGKFTFTQSQNPYQRQPNIFSHIRLMDENEVYLVDGMLSMSFNRPANDYRDASICKVNTGDITSIEYIYPADSSFTLSKNNNLWEINGQACDSTKAANFINTLANKSHRNYSTASIDGKESNYTMVISGNNMQAITIKAFASENEVAIGSSANEGTVFAFNIDDFKQLFKSKDMFY